MYTPNRTDYSCTLTPKHRLSPEAVELATAMQRARTPTYTRNLEEFPGQAFTGLIQAEINLWVVCGSAGVLEFCLVRDGSGDGQLTTLQVVAGQKVEGHFLRIGGNTTCFPLIGFGNLP